VFVLVVAGCQSSIPLIRTPAPAAPTPTPTPTAIHPTFRGMTYPPAGDAPCDEAKAPDDQHAAYTGNLKRVGAEDAQTVVFELCEPDVAFLAKIAAPAFGINDTEWLQNHVGANGGAPQTISTDVNGTGPYRLENWTPGTEISLARNDAYWASAADPERLIVRWDDDPRERVAEVQAGTVDGVDEVDPGGVTRVTDDVSLNLLPRAGLGTVYLGFDTTGSAFESEQVRQAIALGLDRRRIVETLLSAGSEVASHYTPCAVPHGCAGDSWYDYDPTLAKETLSAAGHPDGFDTILHYPATGGPSLPDPTAVAEEIRTELLDNLGIRVSLVAEPDETYLADLDAGAIDEMHLLGREGAYPDVSASLDPRFGANASAEFGRPLSDVTKALSAGSATADDEKREAAYARANAGIRTHVPMIPIGHVGSSTAFRADVDGAVTSPLRLEPFSRMTPGDRRQLVWLTTHEPTGLDCPDETDTVANLVCAQVVEGLYAYEAAGTQPVPSLARECSPNKGLTIWTCALRRGVTFHDGSRLDADDVVLSFAAQWDAEHPLHVGRAGDFPTFDAWFGGFLNSPRRAP
jgi:peptide/nickel transport system substrate-binding protein